MILQELVKAWTMNDEKREMLGSDRVKKIRPRTPPIQVSRLTLSVIRVAAAAAAAERARQSQESEQGDQVEDTARKKRKARGGTCTMDGEEGIIESLVVDNAPSMENDELRRRGSWERRKGDLNEEGDS